MEKIYLIKEIGMLADNSDSKIQQELNYNNNLIHKIDIKLNVVESHVNIISKQVEILHTGETKTQKNIRNMFVIGAAFVTVFGFISYQANADKIDFEIKKVEDKLSSLENKNVIISALVNAIGSRDGYVTTDGKIERINSNDGLYNYTLTLTHESYISVNGDGVGKFMGIYKRYTGEYPLIIAKDRSDIFREGLIKGESFYTDTAMLIEGYPYHVSWSEVLVRAQCKEIDDIWENLKKEKNLGDVYIAPFFETIKNKPMPTLFHIEIGQITSVQGCDDFK